MKIKIIGILLSTILIVTIIPIGVSTVTTSGDIITVDDGGGADYTNIQDAIDNATDGDTIFVYGGVYHENVVVNKSIELVGEDKNETIIHASGIGDIIFVSSSNVSINGFTLTHSGDDDNDAGIQIDLYSSNNTIFNNMFIYCTQGIYMHHSSNNTHIPHPILEK